MPKLPHILGASSNLLGICLILVTAFKISGVAQVTLADEIAMLASVLFMAACLLSYLSIRSARDSDVLEAWADYLFMAGLVVLFVAITVFYTGVL